MQLMWSQKHVDCSPDSFPFQSVTAREDGHACPLAGARDCPVASHTTTGRGCSRTSSTAPRVPASRRPWAGASPRSVTAPSPGARAHGGRVSPGGTALTHTSSHWNDTRSIERCRREAVPGAPGVCRHLASRTTKRRPWGPAAPADIGSNHYQGKGEAIYAGMRHRVWAPPGWDLWVWAGSRPPAALAGPRHRPRGGDALWPRGHGGGPPGLWAAHDLRRAIGGGRAPAGLAAASPAQGVARVPAPA